MLLFKVVGVFRGGGNSFHSLMLQMNGPRVIWGRLPRLALSLFVIFKLTKISSPEDILHKSIEDKGEELDDPVLLVAFNSLNLLVLTFSIVRVSWMVAEQIIFSRQMKAEGSEEEQFVNWTFCRKARQQGNT